MILSKTGRPRYNLLIDSNVIKESTDGEMLGLIAKLCQTAAYHAFRNIKKSQYLGKCFCWFSIKLCASNLDVLQKKPSKCRKFTIKDLESYISQMSPTKICLIQITGFFYIKDTNGFWSLKFLRVCLRQIPSLCELILLVKTYHII